MNIHFTDLAALFRLSVSNKLSEDTVPDETPSSLRILEKEVFSCTCTVCTSCLSQEGLDLTPNSNLNFSFLESIAFSCILEEIIDQLFLFGKNDIAHEVALPNLKEPFKNVCERVGGNCKFDRETVELIETAMPKIIQRKIQDDRHFLKTTLYQTWVDLTNNGSFMSLQETVYFSIKLKNNKLKVCDTNKDLNLKLKSMKDELREIKKKGEYKIKVFDGQMGLLVMKHHDACVVCQHQLRFTDKWERSRLSQLLHFLNSLEEMYKNMKESNITKIFDDTRVHAELVKFYTEKIEVMQNEVYSWSDTYDHDIEKLDNSVIKRGQELEDFYTKYESLSYNYEKRKAEIEEHVEYRDIKSAEKKKTGACIAIQSLWRGLVFRHPELCPKPKKKKKKGGRKKGKK